MNKKNLKVFLTQMSNARNISMSDKRTLLMLTREYGITANINPICNNCWNDFAKEIYSVAFPNIKKTDNAEDNNR